MADLSRAFNYVLINEGADGKIVMDNNAHAVRFGVNEEFHPELLATDFYTTMPFEQAKVIAKQIYSVDYWRPIRGDLIPSQPIATKLLDMAINMGAHQAVKLLQRAANMAPSLVDGRVGRLTLAAIKQVPETQLLHNLADQWKWFIEQTITAHPEDEKYREGWTARAEKIPPLVYPVADFDGEISV